MVGLYLLTLGGYGIVGCLSDFGGEGLVRVAWELLFDVGLRVDFRFVVLHFGV